MAVVHLHKHTEYSLCYAPDGSGSAEEYAEQAASLGQTALGHTDHATLGGALHHIKACRKWDLTPIVGVEAYFRHNRRHTKEDGVESSKAMHLCLHAGSYRGWQNLLAITSGAFTTGDRDGDGFYGKPVADWDLLERHREGVHCTTACVYSPIAEPFLRGDEKEAIANFKRLREIFRDRLWVEIMPHDYDPQRELNPFLINLASEHGHGVVATQDAHMVMRSHAPTHAILQMEQTGQTLAERRAKKDAGEDVYGSELNTLYLTSEAEMEECFREHHPNLPAPVVREAISNTSEFVRSTRFWHLDQDEKLPQVDGDPLEILDKWCWDGLKRIGKLGDEAYEERWKYERGVLVKNGVVPYFVIVGELVRWAKSDDGLPAIGDDAKLVRDAAGKIVYEGKKRPIRVGHGRGSAAGCLISYLVGIVGVDPLAYGLMFERFLNPDRAGLPDIDLDFSSKGREQVKEYLRRRYGYDHVADVIAHQYWAPRAIVKDLGRVYGVPYGEIEKVNKTIDAVKDRGWIKVRESNPVLAEFCKRWPELNRDAEILDEHVHRASKHAAAVIITKDPVADHIPLELSKPKSGSKAKATIVTGWSNRADFEIISDFGFLKVDILGVEGLDRQDYAMDMIRERERDLAGRFVSENPFKRGTARVGSVVEARPDPLDLAVLYDPEAADPKVLEAFGLGATVGVFQFHTPGMTNLLKAIKPTSVLDLAACNALYRPGGMEHAYKYAKHKHGEVPESEWYWHESVIPYMAETYGVLAYQEQVMKICQGLAGFTGGQADGIRKGISKWYRLGKDRCIAKLREFGFEDLWFSGSKRYGLDRAVAELIWDNILNFAGYGFNKSHAVAYALQGYGDMDLKVKNATEFYSAILSMPEDDKGWVDRVVREARSMTVEIKPPDVNRSEIGFTRDGDEILYGMLIVKGIGDKAVSDIIAEREANGPYLGYADFARRNPAHAGGSGRALIEAGAFEGLDGREFLLSEVKKGKAPVTMVRFACGEEVRCTSPAAIAKAVCPTHGAGEEVLNRREQWEHQKVYEHINHNRKLKNPRELPPERIAPTLKELATAEKEMLGVQISVKPSIEKHWNVVEEYVDSLADLEAAAEGDEVQIAGQVVAVKEIKTKKGQPMAFLDLARGPEEFSCTLFTGEWFRFAEVLEEADSVIVSGRKNEYNDRTSIIVNRLQNLEDFVSEVRQSAD